MNIDNRIRPSSAATLINQTQNGQRRDQQRQMTNHRLNQGLLFHDFKKSATTQQPLSLFSSFFINFIFTDIKEILKKV